MFVNATRNPWDGRSRCELWGGCHTISSKHFKKHLYFLNNSWEEHEGKKPLDVCSASHDWLLLEPFSSQGILFFFPLLLDSDSSWGGRWALSDRSHHCWELDRPAGLWNWAVTLHTASVWGKSFSERLPMLCAGLTPSPFWSYVGE